MPALMISSDRRLQNRTESSLQQLLDSLKAHLATKQDFQGLKYIYKLYISYLSQF